MNQKQYELSLEYRISAEFSGMSTGRLSGLWCDGIMLGVFLLNDAKPRILGSAWIGKGNHHEEWKLELLLPKEVGSRDEIDWESLLPPDNVTHWLAVDEKKKIIQIEPSAAVLDPE